MGVTLWHSSWFSIRLHSIGLTSRFCQQLQFLVPLARYQNRIGFLSVFVVLVWSTSRSLPRLQNTVKQLMRYIPSLISHLSSDNQGFNAGGLCTIQNPPSWIHDFVNECQSVESMYFSCYLLCLQHRVQDLHPHRREGITTALLCRICWLCTLVRNHFSAFVQRSITQDDASQVFKSVYICQLGVLNSNVWFYGLGIWHGLVKDFSLVQADNQAEKYSSFQEFVQHQT